jgi:hypothetical protein
MKTISKLFTFINWQLRVNWNLANLDSLITLLNDNINWDHLKRCPLYFLSFGILPFRLICKPGGLDLSRHDLVREPRSWKFEKNISTVQNSSLYRLDYSKISLKKDILTCQVISISISIALDNQDPQAYSYAIL